MKKIYTIFLVVLLTTSLLSQSPQKLSYQAVVRNSGGELVDNSNVGIRIQILQTSEFGAAVYVETHSATTNNNGLITIEIGSGNIVLGTFVAIDWSAGPYFIKTEIDPTGGTNYSITGTSQLLSVPYALQSKVAETAIDAVLLTGNQTINGDKTFTGITTVPAPVNATDAATKDYVDALLTKIQQLENQPGIVKDYDGNLYTTVKIGNQVWMGENLKTTHYRDGESIPIVTDNAAWSNLTTPGYCWYSNNEATYKNIYGALYNWYAVSTLKLCPSDWHLPTDAEWTTLTDYLEGLSVAGGKLKEAGTTHWASPNTGATNETGFSALPAGYRSHNGTDFWYIGHYGYWWSATEFDVTRALLRRMSNDVTSVLEGDLVKGYGFSIRCVRD